MGIVFLFATPEEGQWYVFVASSSFDKQDLISYEIVTRKPFRIKECTGGTGAVCGAIFLTRSFEDFLHQRLGSRADILTPKMIQNAVKTFEGNVKFQFDPYSDGCEAEFEFPLRGAPDIPSIGLEEGYIKVSRYRLENSIVLIK